MVIKRTPLSSLLGTLWSSKEVGARASFFLAALLEKVKCVLFGPVRSHAGVPPLEGRDALDTVTLTSIRRKRSYSSARTRARSGRPCRDAASVDQFDMPPCVYLTSEIDSKDRSRDCSTKPINSMESRRPGGDSENDSERRDSRRSKRTARNTQPFRIAINCPSRASGGSRDGGRRE